MRLLSLALVGASALAAAAPASAAWHEARSMHFVIYADEKPNRLAEFASRLERFDHAARALLQMDDPAVGDGNRVTVYVLPTAKDVQKLAGDSFLSGFYTGRVSGSLAYVAKRDDNSDLGSQTILYHEYSHHLMMQALDQPYPEWYVEGFAEFLSTPSFDKDGGVGIGAPPQGRAWGLFNGQQLAIDALLGGTYGDIRKLSPELRESIYGRGWLLVHYLTMEPKRNGQLAKYVLGIAHGVPPLKSAQDSFGDLKLLDKDLNTYLHRSTVRSFKIASRGAPPAIDVRPLAAGAAAVVLLRGQVKYGLKDPEAGQVLAQVRAVEARFPGDELVETTLAEAELDADHAPAAEAAADRAIKANPKNTEALVLKGRAMVARAETLDDRASHDLFDQARATFIAANKLDAEDPEPLMEFYRAFVSEGVRPTANAIAALHYASDLAPQDLGVRLNSAIAYLMEGKLKDARATLVPVAYSPHGAGVAAMASRMIARIDSGDAKGALMAARSGSPDEAGAH